MHVLLLKLKKKFVFFKTESASPKLNLRRGISPWKWDAGSSLEVSVNSPSSCGLVWRVGNEKASPTQATSQPANKTLNAAHRGASIMEGHIRDLVNASLGERKHCTKSKTQTTGEVLNFPGRTSPGNGLSHQAVAKAEKGRGNVRWEIRKRDTRSSTFSTCLKGLDY